MPHIWHSYKRIFIFDCSAYFKIWGTESYWSLQLRRGSLKPIIGSAVHVGGEQNSACQPFLTALFFLKKTPLKSPQKMLRLFIPPPLPLQTHDVAAKLLTTPKKFPLRNPPLNSHASACRLSFPAKVFQSLEKKFKKK